MKARAALPIGILLGAAAAAWTKANAREGELLPGRTRPLLEHNWRHPRDLQFGANQFRPPDPRAALFTTASGVRAYIVAADDERLVQISAAIPLGRGTERSSEIGAAELISRTIQRAVGDRLGDAFEARVQVEQDVDLTRVSVQVLPDNWRSALAAVASALRDPRFDDAAIASYRTGPGFARQSRGLGGPTYRPAVELARMSGGGYPVAPPDAGKTLERAAVTALAERSLGAGVVVLGIGGKVVRADVERVLREVTAGWPAGAPIRASPPIQASTPSDRRFNTIDEPGYTTWVALGHAMPPIAAAHEAAVAVMNEIINIRLNIGAREMRGLANQTVLQVTATTSQPGLLHVRTAGRPESIAPLKFSTEELARSRGQDGLATADELEQAKGGLVLSQWQRSLDGARAASATYAAETARRGGLDRLTGWPDTVRAVTAEQVRAAAERYIQPDQMRTVIIGQLEAVRKARHPRWPVSLDELMRQ